ncbi:MAG: tRNA (adenosine(37)-N6)-threonylcarbamoyltransferase complex transferase subunit TsaD [bacterium]|nr:tRNA (adenosine(37)-N6)-threonylcarbamoyltransferase complex transferase subunit TsaD [bacterium]
MIILGIETSCDETALSIVESHGTDITVLADKTLSQIALHAKYGGVFPNLAKREHSRNLIPLLKTILVESGFLKLQVTSSKLKVEEDLPTSKLQNLQTILHREPELLKDFEEYIPTIQKPKIDAIAVTEGPGLEPCLWTGINFARALSAVWDIPVIPVNHMEGHIFSALMRREDVTTNYSLLTTNFPALALLISGGHTELVLIKDNFDYHIIGATRDDAVGEAFDKVARLLGLPYPGGPEISKIAELTRQEKQGSTLESSKRLNLVLPTPMLHSPDFDFSFSGLKTAVLYLIQKLPELTDDIKKEIALEFENAVTEVLITKTRKAIEQYNIKTLLIGGGVIANTHIRRSFEALAQELNIPLYIPERGLTTDNALMIATAGYMRYSANMHRLPDEKSALTARGNLTIGEK